MNILTHFTLIALATGGTLFGAGPAPAPAPSSAEVSAKEDAHDTAYAIATTVIALQKEPSTKNRNVSIVVRSTQLPAVALGRLLPTIVPELYSSILQRIIETKTPDYLKTVIEKSRIAKDHFTTAVLCRACGLERDRATTIAMVNIVLDQIDPAEKPAVINAVSNPYELNVLPNIKSADHGADNPLANLILLNLMQSRPHAKEVLEILLQHGADINHTVPTGNREHTERIHTAPLHYAIRSPLWIQSLLEHGANPSVKNSAGKTPREIAEEELKHARAMKADHPEELLLEKHWAETVGLFDQASRYHAGTQQAFVEILMAATRINEGAARNLATIFGWYVTPALQTPTIDFYYSRLDTLLSTGNRPT